MLKKLWKIITTLIILVTKIVIKTQTVIENIAEIYISGEKIIETDKTEIYYLADNVETPEKPSSNPTTDPTTDPKTDPTTDPKTDPKTEPETDPTTDPITDPTTDPTTEPTTNPTTETKLYNISGLAWIDADKNGIKEETEKVLKGVKVKLLNVKTNKIQKDSKNKEIWKEFNFKRNEPYRRRNNNRKKQSNRRS